MNKAIKIKIKDTFYWFFPNDDDKKSGPIVPLEHCDDDGNLDPMVCFENDSFAYCNNGHIKRYGEEIGQLEDFLLDN
jgi:hypothetical protein